MADSKIQVGFSDDYLNTNTVTTSAGLVHNEVVETNNVISTTSFNSLDAANLAAEGVFQGVGEDVSNYGRVGVA